METVILFSVGLSSLVFAHILALRRRFILILSFLAITAALYAVIHWYVGTVDGWDGLALAIFAMIAVMPFAAGLVLGLVTGSVHLRWKSAGGKK